VSSRRFGVIASKALLALLLVWPRGVFADSTPVDGPWNMTALTETFTVQQWSRACGPAPVSRQLQPGGAVMIMSQNGELVIAGGQRTLRTDQCLDPMPTLTRDAHSTDGRSWRTRCSTPSGDSRRAVVNNAFFLTGEDGIAIAETGRYEFAINNVMCIADVNRAASLRRAIAPASTPPPSSAVAPIASTPESPPPNASTTPAPPAKPDCSTPGQPARLEVRPSRKLLRLGDPFAFRAVVLDARGCVTATPIQWSIGALRFKDGQVHPEQPAVDGAGRLSVPPAFADATFDVIAAAAGRNARASVDVTSPATYEALLAQSGLNSNGERDEAAIAILATGSIGASDIRAEDGARHRRFIFIVVVGSLTLALGAVAVVGALRARRARGFERAAEERHAKKMRDHERHRREREERHALQMQAHLESVARAQQAAATAAAQGIDPGPTFCPSCRKEFPSGTTFCPFDSNRLVAVAGHEDLMTGPAGGICPTCKRGFNPGIKVCPHDGEELVPLGMMASPPVVTRGKICPTCGDRFDDAAAAFCGKDGTQLVLLN
jgi:hypothetical protein